MANGPGSFLSETLRSLSWWGSRLSTLTSAKKTHRWHRCYNSLATKVHCNKVLLCEIRHPTCAMDRYGSFLEVRLCKFIEIPCTVIHVTIWWDSAPLLYSIRVAEPPQKAFVLNETITFLGASEKCLSSPMAPHDWGPSRYLQTSSAHLLPAHSAAGYLQSMFLTWTNSIFPNPSRDSWIRYETMMTSYLYIYLSFTLCHWTTSNKSMTKTQRCEDRTFFHEDRPKLRHRNVSVLRSPTVPTCNSFVAKPTLLMSSISKAWTSPKSWRGICDSQGQNEGDVRLSPMRHHRPLQGTCESWCNGTWYVARHSLK